MRVKSEILNSHYRIYKLETSMRPASINKQFSKSGNAKRRASKDYFAQEWKRMRGTRGPFEGYCKLSIDTSFDQDIDSPLKTLLDSMKNAIIKDDKQIIELVIRRSMCMNGEQKKIVIILECVGNVRDFMNARLNCEEF